MGLIIVTSFSPLNQKKSYSFAPLNREICMSTARYANPCPLVHCCMPSAMIKTVRPFWYGMILCICYIMHEILYFEFRVHTKGRQQYKLLVPETGLGAQLTGALHVEDVIFR
jgi:hypothetical protein